MIKSFCVSGQSPEEFINKVTETLSTRELGKIVTLKVLSDNIIMTFSKLGKSEITFSLKKGDNGFSCDFMKDKIALTHKALRNEMESKFAKLLESLGATVSQG